MIVSGIGLFVCYYQFGQNSKVDMGVGGPQFEGFGAVLIGLFIIFAGFVLGFVCILYKNKRVSNLK
jgi:hypothetical protein